MGRGAARSRLRRPFVASSSVGVSVLLLACGLSRPGEVDSGAPGGGGVSAEGGGGGTLATSGASSAGTAGVVPTGSGGSMGTGGSTGTAGSSGVAGDASAALACDALDTPTPVFAGQVVMGLLGGFPRELYSWTTSEQIEEIRAGGVLLTRSEREGLGPGFAIEALTALAEGADTPPDVAALATLLTGDAFAKARYAWPYPWATRMGWPGETYGDQLLRIVLRDEAWLVVFVDGTLSVMDASGEAVALADALARPERLAGFYFVRDAKAGGPYCQGSFVGGGDGYREFVIGNEAMIAEFSHGTDAIGQRLQRDIDQLTVFLQRTSGCPERVSVSLWNLLVGCAWPGSRGGISAEQAAYETALSMLSPAYRPTQSELTTLLDTLKADPFELDPLVVRPAPPGG